MDALKKRKSGQESESDNDCGNVAIFYCGGSVVESLLGYSVDLWR